MDILNSCKFCGHGAELTRYPMPRGTAFRVICPRSKGGCGVQAAAFKDKDKAIKAWNRTPTDG